MKDLSCWLWPKNIFLAHTDCLQFPLNWKWGRICEDCCLKKFPFKKSLPRYHESLQPTLKCWVGTCHLLEKISPIQFLVFEESSATHNWLWPQLIKTSCKMAPPTCLEQVRGTGCQCGCSKVPWQQTQLKYRKRLSFAANPPCQNV